MTNSKAKMQFTRQTPPYDTGKVLIGLTYTAPPPAYTRDEEVIQAVLLGEDPFQHRNELIKAAICVVLIVVAMFMVRA